jgi:hypothetical protein
MNRQPSDLMVKWEIESTSNVAARLAAAFDMLLREEGDRSLKEDPLDNFLTAIKDQSD